MCTVNFEKHSSIRFYKVSNRVKPKRDLCTVPPKAGEASCSLSLPFLVGVGTFSGWDIPSWCRLGGMGCRRQNAALFLAFCVVLLRVFVALCC